MAASVWTAATGQKGRLCPRGAKQTFSGCRWHTRKRVPAPSSMPRNIGSLISVAPRDSLAESARDIRVLDHHRPVGRRTIGRIIGRSAFGLFNVRPHGPSMRDRSASQSCLLLALCVEQCHQRAALPRKCSLLTLVAALSSRPSRSFRFLLVRAQVGSFRAMRPSPMRATRPNVGRTALPSSTSTAVPFAGTYGLTLRSRPTFSSRLQRLEPAAQRKR